MSNRSLIDIGMPAVAGSVAPLARNASTASAWARAPARSTCRKVLAPSPAPSSMRSRHASSSARPLTRPAARSADNVARVGEAAGSAAVIVIEGPVLLRPGSQTAASARLYQAPPDCAKCLSWQAVIHLTPGLAACPYHLS